MNKQPIRILHVIGIMHRGGAETMIMNYYRHIDRTKVQFDFVENSDRSAEFDEEITALGGRIYRCPHYTGKNHFQYIAWWKAFYARHGGDYKAVHGHIGSTAAIYLSLAKKVGLYTVAHSHNTCGWSLKDMVYQIYAYPTRFVADSFFGCSRDAGISRYGRRTCSKSDKFRVLNNAIEKDKFTFNSEVREKLRSQLGISEKIVIGHAGRFVDQKNHVFLIRIFAEIHRRNPDVVLLLLGDGEKRPEIERLVHRLGLEKAVFFEGVRENINDYYQAMDIFVLPSLYEGLGIVAVEAQAAGLPCVISDGVSKECVVTRDLVRVCRLRDTADHWAEQILSCVGKERTDTSDQLKRSGYDIKENAAWLERFYLKIGEV